LDMILVVLRKQQK